MSVKTCFERFQRILEKRKSENSRFSLFWEVSFGVVADHIIFLLRNHVTFRNSVSVIYDSGPFYFFSLLWFFLQFWRFGFFFDLTRLRTRLNIFFRRSRFFFQKNTYVNPGAACCIYLAANPDFNAYKLLNSNLGPSHTPHQL